MTAVRSGWPARLVLTAVLFVVASPLIATARTAHAATAYRYWTYYVGHGTSWEYSQRGPSAEYPVDGEVQGWRFAVQTDAAGGLTPRATPAFARLCAAKPAKPGQLRVAIVVDFGNPGDAPPHEKPPAGVVPGCVYVSDGASGADVLQAAAAARIGTGADAGLVCGIDNYPKTECATVVTAPVSAHASAPAPATALRPRSATPTPVTKATPPTASVAASSSPGVPLSSSPPSSVPPGPTPATAPSTARPAVAAPSTLADLRSSAHHRQHFPASAVAGSALVVLLGGAALWRARAGRS